MARSNLISRLPSSREDLLIAAGLMQSAIAEGNDDLAAIRALLEAQAPSTLALLQLLRDPAVGCILAGMAALVAITTTTLGPTFMNLIGRSGARSGDHTQGFGLMPGSGGEG